MIYLEVCLRHILVHTLTRSLSNQILSFTNSLFSRVQVQRSLKIIISILARCALNPDSFMKSMLHFSLGSKKRYTCANFCGQYCGPLLKKYKPQVCTFTNQQDGIGLKSFQSKLWYQELSKEAIEIEQRPYCYFCCQLMLNTNSYFVLLRACELVLFFD